VVTIAASPAAYRLVAFISMPPLSGGECLHTYGHVAGSGLVRRMTNFRPTITAQRSHKWLWC
jgi:hypothetical protein